MIVFGGIGDKTDEWGDKWHLEMDKQAAKTLGRIGYEQQFTSTMIKSLWRYSDHPSARSKLEEGLKKTSRGIYNSGGISQEQ